MFYNQNARVIVEHQLIMSDILVGNLVGNGALRYRCTHSTVLRDCEIQVQLRLFKVS